MKDFSNVNGGRRRFLRHAVYVSTATLIHGRVRASESEEGRRYFNVPKGEAIKSLKLAVKQAKVEFILSAELLKGVETNKIKGRFTPIEAFGRMLHGSELMVVQHEKSGVYSVKKTTDIKASAADGNQRR